MKKFGFIGVGNMGGALAKAVAKNLSDDCIFVCDHDNEKQNKLADELHCNTSDAKTISKNCDYVVIGVKPQVGKSLSDEIKSVLISNKNVVIISMMAGVTIRTIAELFGEHPIIRIMPNMPAQIGEGVILCSFQNVDEASASAFCDAFSKAGMIDEIPEHLMDVGCAVSGSGPAYAFAFIEALADGAVACGLPRDKAILYAAKTIAGAANLVVETGEHPEKLKDAVCSPGGTTIQGIYALEKGGFRSTAINAVVAGFEKSKELSKSN